MNKTSLSPLGIWRRLRRWQQATVVLAAVAGIGALVPTEPAALPPSAMSTSTTSVPTTTSAPTTSTSTSTSTTAPTTTSTATTSSSTSSIPTTTLPPPTAPPTTLPTGGVVLSRVVDGDTIDVTIDGVSESLRLIGINSPENGECYSDEATSRLRDLVEGRTVTLRSDESNRDQYGRLLRYVYVGDVFVNEVLVREGFAIARRYEPDTARAETLEAAQDAAKREELGMWAAEACGAATPVRITLSDIHYDAAGNDNNNLNDEWVAFTNAGGGVDLTGWSVKDESASHRYHFPAGFSLEAGASVRLFTGCGNDSTTALYWCNQGSAVWNNGGDTVFLLDPSGNVAVSGHYDG